MVIGWFFGWDFASIRLQGSMAVYTHLDDAQIAAVTARFGFETLHRAQGIAEGVENSNYLIEGTRAGAAQKAILTLFEKRMRVEELPFFMTLMQHLAARGIACPTPLQHDDGEMLLELLGKQACMVSFLEGRSQEPPTLSACKQLGRAMAQMHLAGEGMTMTRANNLSLSGWQSLYQKMVNDLNGVSPDLQRFVEEELAQLEVHWPKELPRGIIHADLFPNNVFFDVSGMYSGIIDFYFACEDFYAYDIAICLNCWCFDAQHAYSADKAQAMIKAYDAVRPLSSAEREALPLLARGAALRFLLTRAYDVIHHDEQALVSPHDPMEYVYKLRWWQSYKEVI